MFIFKYNLPLKKVENKIFTMHNTSEKGNSKNIALVAHDHKKADMLNWIRENKDKFISHRLFATGTTGKLIEKELGIEVTKLKSGPLGGDQQIGALIAENKIDILFFFWDPLEPQPHDPDVKALLRLAVVWNIPVASNIASADFLINSNFFKGNYSRKMPDFKDYIERKI